VQTRSEALEMKYTRKPYAVDAVQFNGQNHLNIFEDYWPDWIHHAIACGDVQLCGDYFELWRPDHTSWDRFGLGCWIVLDDGAIIGVTAEEFYRRYDRVYNRNADNR